MLCQLFVIYSPSHAQESVFKGFPRLPLQVFPHCVLVLFASKENLVRWQLGGWALPVHLATRHVPLQLLKILEILHSCRRQTVVMLEHRLSGLSTTRIGKNIFISKFIILFVTKYIIKICHTVSNNWSSVWDLLLPCFTNCW